MPTGELARTERRRVAEDSTVSLFKRAKAYGGNVTVAGLKDQPLAIFRLLRLDRVFAL